jgi:hypothetical protein
MRQPFCMLARAARSMHLIRTGIDQVHRRRAIRQRVEGD